jgi:hypothetical protein
MSSIYGVKKPETLALLEVGNEVGLRTNKEILLLLIVCFFKMLYCDLILRKLPVKEER